jgi:hypothetical protein
LVNRRAALYTRGAARFFLAALAISIPFLAGAQAPAAPAPSFADVAVGRIDDLGKPFDLKANVYLPPGAGGATPLVLYIHGKGGAYDDPRDQVVQRILARLLARGIAVARIDYRRSGRMPAMLFDTKAYLRFFRALVGDYHIHGAAYYLSALPPALSGMGL